MRYISSQMVERYGTKIRIVAAASSLANARDLGEWIGATHPQGCPDPPVRSEKSPPCLRPLVVPPSSTPLSVSHTRFH